MPIEGTAVRRAHLDEAEQIMECLALAFHPFRSQYTDGAFRDTVPGSEVIRERMATMAVYVAVSSDGDVVGTLTAGYANHEGHLRGMAVRPEWQGMQVAQRLLARAENDLIEAGCTRITLDTTEPLTRAIHFYEKNGFTSSGEIREFFGMPLYEFMKCLWPRSSSLAH